MNQEKLIRYILKREWHWKLAKERGGEQSLFAHALNELYLANVFTDLLGWSESQKEELQLSCVLHDIGKETDNWQQYIRGESSNNVIRCHSHVDPKITEAALKDLKNLIEHKVRTNDVKQAILMHMKAERTDSAYFESFTSTTTDFQILLDILLLIDHLASTSSLANALSWLRGDQIIKRFPKDFQTSIHSVCRTRGLSTILLHQAAEDVFLSHRWIPTLYFPSGTLYLGLKGLKIPTKSEIEQRFSKKIREIAQERRREVIISAIGSPTTKIIVPNVFLYMKTMGTPLIDALIDKYSSGVKKRFDRRTGQLKDTEIKKLHKRSGDPPKSKLDRYLEIAQREDMEEIFSKDSLEKTTNLCGGQL